MVRQEWAWDWVDESQREMKREIAATLLRGMAGENSLGIIARKRLWKSVSFPANGNSKRLRASEGSLAVNSFPDSCDMARFFRFANLRNLAGDCRLIAGYGVPQSIATERVTYSHLPQKDDICKWLAFNTI